ncbi:MAG: HesA/MoeB/ThiF family protein [Candidatus Omnitrophota bacterium]
MGKKQWQGLTDGEKKRYSRQIILDNFGQSGQEKLKNAVVFVAGAGGLASSALPYLAASGIGTIRVCDYDAVELSNLNRQVVHSDRNIGINKARSAKKRLRQVNPTIIIKTFECKIDETTVRRIVGNSNIIVDCTDNLSTRLVLNAYAVQKKIPFVFGSVWGLKGYLSFFHVPETPCLECVFQKAPHEGEFPVLGTTPGVIGTFEALEVIKYFTGIGMNCKNKMLIFDGALLLWKTVHIARNPECPICSKLR